MQPTRNAWHPPYQAGVVVDGAHGLGVFLIIVVVVVIMAE
jgi:hypothetical protein